MLQFMQAIASYTFSPLNSTHTSCVSPFPIILTLWNSWIYICTLDGGNITPHIETPVDKALCLDTTLYIPNIKPDNQHI